jgi:hypothetical protein
MSQSTLAKVQPFFAFTQVLQVMAGPVERAVQVGWHSFFVVFEQYAQT